MGFPVRNAADVDRLENICSTEPTRPCPTCGATMRAEWVDIGFGPYSQQAGPFHCDKCDWVEDCPYVDPATCHRCLCADTCFRPKDVPE